MILNSLGWTVGIYTARDRGENVPVIPGIIAELIRTTTDVRKSSYLSEL